MCDPDDEDFEVNPSQLTKRMKHLASVLNHFWRRWRSEYQNELRESYRYMAKKVSHRTIAEGKQRCPMLWFKQVRGSSVGLNHPELMSILFMGDVVIVHDEALPRGLWKLGRIKEVFIGRDGLPHSALVRVATRDRQHTLLKRSLQLLYPLEIHEPEPPKDPSENVPIVSQDEQTSDTPIPERHPVRAADEWANEKRIWIQELQGQA